MKSLLPILILLMFTQCDEQPSNSSELRQIASEFNEKGARMIDSETRIDAIDIKGENTIVYKYTLINLLQRNVDTNEFKRALKPGIISVIKVSPEMKKLRDQKANFEYYYNDKQNKFIYNIKIFPKDYQ